MISPARFVKVWAHLVSPHASPENTEIIKSSLKGWNNMTTKYTLNTYLCKEIRVLWMDMYISKLSNCNMLSGTYCKTCCTKGDFYLKYIF